MPRRAAPLAALLAAVALLAAACSIPDPKGGPRGGQAAPATGTSSSQSRRPGTVWATGAPVRVVMNDRFRYQPSAIMVRAGHRVTFDVTNAGKLPHEFILGDRAAQLEHEREMRAATGGDMDMQAHTHLHGSDAPAGGTGGLTVPPGQTRRLTWTFDKPGIVLYGCHVLGHWAAGMRGTIVVLAPDRPLPLPAVSALGR
jgi:uncharacterized cupredoxin-like copper-binding protein